MRRGLTLVLLAGCSRVLGFEELTPSPADSDDPRCSSLSSLTDTFDRPNLAQWNITQTGFSSISTQDGHVVFLMENTDATAQITYRSFFRLQESAFTVELIPLTAFGTEDAVVLRLRAPSVDPQFEGLELQIADGTIEAFVRRRDGSASLGRTAYTGQRFFRIAETNKTTSFRVSNDTVNFELIGELLTGEFPNANVPTVVVPEISVLHGPAATGTFSIQLESVNGELTETSPSCSAARFVEPFNKLSFNPQLWSDVQNAGCDLDLGNDELILTARPEGTCLLRSALSYDLRGGGFAIELSNVPSGIFRMEAEFSNHDHATWQIGDGALEVSSSLTGMLTAAPFDPVAHRFIRLRSVDDIATWETSPDGGDYTIFAEVPLAGGEQSQLILEHRPPDDMPSSITLLGINAP